MIRWRVAYSTRTATWFYGEVVAFVDADDAVDAAALVAGPGRDVWDVRPSTPALEQAHKIRQARIAEWQANVKHGIPNTGKC